MKHKNLKLTSFTALGEDVIQVENELREYAKTEYSYPFRGWSLMQLYFLPFMNIL